MECSWAGIILLNMKKLIIILALISFKHPVVTTINILDYGANGNGVFDNATAIANACAASNGKTIIFPAGNFYIGSTLTVPIANTVWQGAGSDQTTITYSAGYTVIQANSFNNARITGIFFNNTYSNATEGGTGIFYTSHISLINVEIDHCKFSCPNANNDAISLQTNIGDSTLPQRVMFNVNIHHNDFVSIGRIAVDIFNRKYDVLGQSRAKDIHVDYNTADSLGTKGTWGLFASFDGTGSFASCSYNYIKNAYKAGIEMNYGSSKVLGNTLEYTTRLFIPIEIDPIVPVSNIVVAGNTSIGQNSYCTFFNVFNCQFYDNNFTANMSTSDGDGTVYLIGSNNTFTRETYNSTATTLRISSQPSLGARFPNTSSTNNIFTNCNFVATTGAGSRTVVSMDSSLTSNNIFIGCTFTKAANTAYIQQIRSAISNVIDSSSVLQ